MAVCSSRRRRTSLYVYAPMPAIVHTPTTTPTARVRQGEDGKRVINWNSINSQRPTPKGNGRRMGWKTHQQACLLPRGSTALAWELGVGSWELTELLRWLPRAAAIVMRRVTSACQFRRSVGWRLCGTDGSI